MDQPPNAPESAPDDEPEVLDDVELVEAGDDGEPMEAELLDDGDAVPPPRPPDAGEAFEDISPADREFLSRVFRQVAKVDFRAMPPPPSRGLTGLDKKMAGLREDVRRLERDLARVAHIWRIKQVQVEKVEAIIAHEQAKRTQADSRYAKIKAQAARAASDHRTQAAQLGATIEQLEQTKAAVEDQLTIALRNLEEQTGAAQKQREENAALVANFKQKIAQAQEAFNHLREQSTQRIGTLENQLHEREQAYETLDRERGEEVAALNSEIVLLNEKLEEREATITRVTTELSEVRGVLEPRVADLEGDVGRLESQLDTSLANAKSLEETVAQRDGALADKERQVLELSKELKDRYDELTATRNTVAQQEGRLGEQQRRLESVEGELKSTGEALQRAEVKAEDREASLERLEAQVGALNVELRTKSEGLLRAETQVEDRDRRIQDLKARIDRLESSRQAAPEPPPSAPVPSPPASEAPEAEALTEPSPAPVAVQSGESSTPDAES